MSSGHDVDVRARWVTYSALDGLDLATHEIVERRMVARYVRPGDLVLEGGAGIGAVTRVLLDGGATVHAFEPGPEQWPSLVALAGAYPAGQCQPFNLALAPESGSVPYHVYAPWYANRIGALGGAVPSYTMRIQARAWREVLEQPYTGLVIDIEGAEHAILRGAAPMPSALRWIVAELHGSPTEMANTLSSVRDSGFRLDAVEAHFTYLVAGWVRITP